MWNKSWRDAKSYITWYARGSRGTELTYANGGRASKSNCSTIIGDFFVKFDLEIAIDQHTRACDRTFEGCPPAVLAGQPRPFLV